MNFAPYYPLIEHPVPNPFLLARMRAKGVPVPMLAKLVGIGEREVERTVEAPDFPELVAKAERLRDLSHEERLSRLCDQAFDLLEAALAAGDLRVGLYVVCERQVGRSAAQTLAHKVIEADAALTRALARKVERDFAPPVVASPPPVPQPGRRTRQNGLVRLCNRAEAILLRDLASTEVVAAPSAAEIKFGQIAAAIARLKAGSSLAMAAPAFAGTPQDTARTPRATGVLDRAGDRSTGPARPAAPPPVPPLPAPTAVAAWPAAP